MKKILIVFSVLVLLLCGCGPAGSLINGTPLPIQSTLITDGGGSAVYKFVDGTRTCYFSVTESGVAPSGGIWCTP